MAEIWRFKFSGFFAWWLWRTIYLFKLPGLERKLRVALDWTLDLFFRRDIVLLKVFMKKTNRRIPLVVPENCCCDGRDPNQLTLIVSGRQTGPGNRNA